MKNITVIVSDKEENQPIISKGRAAISFAFSQEDEQKRSGIYVTVKGKIRGFDIINMAQGTASAVLNIIEGITATAEEKKILLELFCDMLQNELGLLKDEQKKKKLNEMIKDRYIFRMRG